MTEDEKFMKAALAQAKKAAAIDEVPIGCVIVYEGKIIARGYNKRNKEKNTLSHAEMNAIRKASKYLGDWRLEGCTMYITLEPCPMCAGAMVMSQLGECVYGAADPRQGCCGSVYDLPGDPALSAVTRWRPAPKSKECGEILREFMRGRRLL